MRLGNVGSGAAVFDGIQVVLENGELLVLADESLLCHGDHRWRIVDGRAPTLRAIVETAFPPRVRSRSRRPGCCPVGNGLNQVEEEVKFVPPLWVVGEWIASILKRELDQAIRPA